MNADVADWLRYKAMQREAHADDLAENVPLEASGHIRESRTAARILREYAEDLSDNRIDVWRALSQEIDRLRCALADKDDEL